MGKILSIVIGAAAVIAGLALLVFGTPGSMGWWYELLFVIRGVLPLMMILGGVISVIAGWSEIRDLRKSGNR